jgi:hypothetical protein
MKANRTAAGLGYCCEYITNIGERRDGPNVEREVVRITDSVRNGGDGLGVGGVRWAVGIWWMDMK